MTQLVEQYVTASGPEGDGFVKVWAPTEREAPGARRISTSEQVQGFTAGTLAVVVEPGLLWVRVTLPGQPGDPVLVDVPDTITPVRLSSLLPQVPVEDTVGVLTEDRLGVPGGVARLDAVGQVLNGAGQPVTGGGGGAGVVYPFAAAATWTVTHSLGRFPYAVQVVVGTEEVLADVAMPTTTQVVITHSSPATGRVTLI